MTRDSFLPFGSCNLCLLPAREPVACSSGGHLFCRECALSNLLAQNQELKRLKKETERRHVEEEEEKGLEDDEARAKAVEEFEKVQAGLGDAKKKRKYQFDEIEAKRKRLNTTDDKELPSFWVPSETPSAQKAALKQVKEHPTCPASDDKNPHDLTLKKLVTINFHGKSACPACDKALSNATKAVLAKPCGHVLCKPCSEKFQRVDEHEGDGTARCYVCQEDVTPGRKAKRKDKDGKEKESKVDRGLVELASDGTGFAGGGKNMVKKEGVAFQC